jgi:hypothetical protein
VVQCSISGAPWQRLNFLPLPHGHGSLRPGEDAFRRACCGPRVASRAGPLRASQYAWMLRISGAILFTYAWCLALPSMWVSTRFFSTLCLFLARELWRLLASLHVPDPAHPLRRHDEHRTGENRAKESVQGRRIHRFFKIIVGQEEPIELLDFLRGKRSLWYASHLFGFQSRAVPGRQRPPRYSDGDGVTCQQSVTPLPYFRTRRRLRFHSGYNVGRIDTRPCRPSKDSSKRENNKNSGSNLLQSTHPLLRRSSRTQRRASPVTARSWTRRRCCRGTRLVDGHPHFSRRSRAGARLHTNISDWCPRRHGARPGELG